MIGIGLSIVTVAVAAALNSRHFATLNGTSQSMTMNAPAALVSGDTAGFITYPTDIASQRFLCDSDVVDAASLPVYTAATTGFYNWPAGLVSSATLNGVPISNNTTAPTLGVKNELVLTISAPARIAVLGISQAGAGWFQGQYDTFTHTPIATGIPLVYELSSGSLTTQYAKGFASPSANYLTLVNFQDTAPASWELMERVGTVWHGADLVDTMNTAVAWAPVASNTVVDDAGSVLITYVDDARGAAALFRAANGLSVDLVAGSRYSVDAVALCNVASGANIRLYDGTAYQTDGVLADAFSAYNWTITANGLPQITFSLMGAGENVRVKGCVVKHVLEDA